MDELDQSRSNNRGAEWIDAPEAASLLGVKTATLYTYVSRGLLRRVPAAEGRRGSRYSRIDIDRLRSRQGARAGHAPAAAEALRWGQPVIDTRVGGITNRGPIYRGLFALDLVRDEASYEEVTNLLMGTRGSWKLRPTGAAVTEPVPEMIARIAVAALDDPGRFGAGAAAETRRARRILGILAGCLPMKGVARRPLDACLVSVADHGLTASTLAARVTASTGADLYSCVLSALAALSGPQHGGAVLRIEALLDEAGAAGRAADVVHRRLRRGEQVPGFGHPLYRGGDPRAAPLLEIAHESDHPRVRTAFAVIDAMEGAGHAPPSVDMGLVAASDSMGMPPGSAAGLFALGRAAGWIAHVFEQREAGWMLRPRARYVPPSVE